MTIPAGRNGQETSSEIGGDLFFWRSTPPKARPRSRSEIERPVFDQKAVVRPNIWFRQRRPTAVPLLLMQRRDAQMEVYPA